MRVRTASLAAILVGALAVPAAAAPQRCPLVVDPAGDVRVMHGPDVEAPLPELDLLSIDLASSSRVLTVVLRVSDLSARSAHAPLGGHWEVSFWPRGSGQLLALWATRGADGTVSFAAGYGPPYLPNRTTLGPVAGLVDLARDEIRIVAPLAVFAPVVQLSRGVLLEGVSGLSRRHLLPGGTIGQDADYTDHGTHRIGSAPCRT